MKADYESIRTGAMNLIALAQDIATKGEQLKTDFATVCMDWESAAKDTYEENFNAISANITNTTDIAIEVGNCVVQYANSLEELETTHASAKVGTN